MIPRLTSLLLLIPALLSADTYPRQTGIDVVHYVFRLGLTDTSDEITGEATVTVKFLRDGVVDLSLDLTSLAAGKGMTVLSVRRGGPIDVPGSRSDNIVFTHAQDRLRLVLPPLSKAGEELTFTVRYRGFPGGGLRIGENIHRERTFFSENWPNNARQWLPMLDHPSDKATGEFIITAPSHYQVVANGLLVEELDLPDSTRRTHWKQSVPISSWLYAIGVARFSFHSGGETNGVPLQTWVFPQDREPGIRLFEDLSRRAMDFFVRQIGPYSYEKLANVEAAGLNGGTEHASAIFYGEKGVTNGNGPVVHEIAHQWWGNSVTERDWDDVWLSEGFATYFTLLFTEHDAGRDAFVAGLKQSRASVLQLEQKLPDTPVIHRNLSDMRRVLNGLVYQKAGWVLHMLREEVGTAHFWTAIREYYRRYRNDLASTTELRTVFEQVSGKPLDWFFTQWLTRPGVPKIEGAWRYDPVKKVVEVTLTQSQAAAPYRLNVGVGIVARDGDRPRIETIELTDRQVVRTFAMNATPATVLLDPNTALLMEQGTFVQR
ncbi:MAG TPA: M1 family metallopeptidase [Vicinamibacterales bacterium]|nr:M1 family metallopeptidase [Vicinamibacterales bacterium]